MNMHSIAYAQVQELVMRLPARKLPLAYRLLTNLLELEKEVEPISPQVQFMFLPVEERRRVLAQQAERMVAHYAQSVVERQDWQAGDFYEY
jgi:hypothetical protein